MFQSAVGIVKSKGKTDKWKELTFQGTQRVCVSVATLIRAMITSVVPSLTSTLGRGWVIARCSV
jgi:hypothetical protein